MLTSVTISNNVTEIGAIAFLHCKNLTSVTNSSRITKIESTTFADCINLTSVTIPNSVTEIGESAFAACGLTSVTIPSNVTKIGEDAFKRCVHLISITSLNPVPPVIKDGEAFNYIPSTAVLYVPESGINAYKRTEGWSDFGKIRPVVN